MTDETPSLHPDSWYAASCPSTDYPQLLGDHRADVCVVGGGIAGCSAALHLAEFGYRVILLESDRVGSGASGRNGGQALPGVSCGQAALEDVVGAEQASRVWHMTLEGLQLQRELITRHQIDCDWQSGHVQVCHHARHERALRTELDYLADRHDYQDLEWLDSTALQQFVRSPRYQSGALDRRAGHLHPLKYTQGLARAAAAAGVLIHERSRVLHRRALRSDRASGTAHGLWQLETAQGRVRCDTVVLAGNATLGAVEPALERKIIGVGTYMVATQPLGEARALQLLPADVAVSDMNWVLDYFRLSADRRLLFGGEVSYSGLDPARHARALQTRLQRVFPQLVDIEISHRWGGWVDITVNRAPHFGQLEPDVFFVQGFSGHGLALAGLAGQLLAEAVRGTSERFDVFARIPHHDFPGGAGLRRPALVLAMLWYRLRDLL